MATDERRGGGRQVAECRHGRRRGQRRVVRQDLLFEPSQLGSGLDPELVEPRAGLALCIQRIGLPARAIQRLDERARESLPERMGRHEALERGNELGVAAEQVLELETALDRCESLLLQAGCLDRRKGRVTEIGERVAAPEVERLAERRDGGCRLLGSGSLDEVLEARDVQLVRIEVEGVAGGVRHDSPGPDCLAEPVHADLQRVRRRLGRSLAPESVDET